MLLCQRSRERTGCGGAGKERGESPRELYVAGPEPGDRSEGCSEAVAGLA